MLNWNSFVKFLTLSYAIALSSWAQGDVEKRQFDPDPKVRLAAVEELIETGGARSAELLRTSCRDGSGEIQHLAVAGIVNFYFPGYVKKGVRAKITKVGDKILRHDPELVIDPWVRTREEDGEAILGVLREPKSAAAKLEAAQALGTLRVKRALPDLYPLLKSKDDALMLAALRAIEVSSDKAAAQETVFLMRDLNDRIQQKAIAINGVTRNEGALPDLAEVYARGRSNQSRAAALEAIAMIGSTDSKGLFEQNLEAREPALRGFAAEGLGRIEAKDLAPKIREVFESETAMRARLGQAFALVRLGDRSEGELSPLTYLFNTLNSMAWDEYAESYLEELSRDVEVREMLRRKVAGATKSEKIGLAGILSRVGGADDKATLDSIANDKDPQVAQAGIKATRTYSARLP